MESSSAPIWANETYGFEDPSFWEIDNKMCEFAKDLNAVTLEAIVDPAYPQVQIEYMKLNRLFLHDDDDEVLSQMKTGRDKVFNSIFLRPSVKQVWDAVFEMLTRADATENAEFFGNACLKVTGNSGIGKSYSMLYLLKKFLDAGRYVFFDNRKTMKVYAFIPRNKGAATAAVAAAPVEPEPDVVEYEVFVSSAKRFKATEKKLLSTFPGNLPPPVLWDTAEDMEDNFVPSYIWRARTALNVSIKEDLVKNAYKDFAVETWYLSQYSLPELQVIRNHAHQATTSAQVLRYRFYRYGGLIRLAFANQSTLRQFNRTVTECIGRLSMESLETILSGAVGSFYKIVSTGVFKIVPKNGSNFLDFDVDFGSPYMYALLAGQFWQHLARKGRGNDKQYTSWFEAMVIHKLAMGGKFEVRNLKEKGAAWEELDLDEVPIEIVRGNGSNSVNDTFYTQWGQLTSRTKMLNSSSTNLPVVDCADKAGRGFQATAARENHVISYDECAKILDKMARLQLYFVVPDWNADSFKKQTFKGVSNSKTGNKGKNLLAERVDQYVLKLGVDHIKDLCTLYVTKETKLEELLEFNDAVERSESIRKRRRLD